MLEIILRMKVNLWENSSATKKCINIVFSVEDKFSNRDKNLDFIYFFIFIYLVRKTIPPGAQLSPM